MDKKVIPLNEGQTKGNTKQPPTISKDSIAPPPPPKPKSKQ